MYSWASAKVHTIYSIAFFVLLGLLTGSVPGLVLWAIAPGGMFSQLDTPVA
jgi:hypothetical protein